MKDKLTVYVRMTKEESAGRVTPEQAIRLEGDEDNLVLVQYKPIEVTDERLRELWKKYLTEIPYGNPYEMMTNANFKRAIKELLTQEK